MIKRSGTAADRPPPSPKLGAEAFFTARAFVFSQEGNFMFSKLKEELDSIMDRDPAARSRLEVFFLYSGFKAMRSYRLAHWFYLHDRKFIARWRRRGSSIRSRVHRASWRIGFDAAILPRRWAGRRRWRNMRSRGRISSPT